MNKFDIYLAAVERIIGFPYAEVVVSVVEECFNEGWGVDECADRLTNPDHSGTI